MVHANDNCSKWLCKNMQNLILTYHPGDDDMVGTQDGEICLVISHVLYPTWLFLPGSTTASKPGEYDVPEILRTPLTTLYLKAKGIADGLSEVVSGPARRKESWWFCVWCIMMYISDAIKITWNYLIFFLILLICVNICYIIYVNIC
jgi:hypothetical protein